MSNEIPNDPPKTDVEILGQKFVFPNTTHKLIAFLVLVTGVVFLVWYALCNRYTLVKNKEGFTFSFVDNNKVKVVAGYTIGFWTPSDSTAKYLHTADSSSLKEFTEKYGWQIKPQTGESFEKANIEFGKLLRNKFGFGGYRRIKVWGEGESGIYKEGYWWSINFRGKCDDEFLKELKDVYSGFWLQPDIDKKWDNLYVEIIGNRE